TNLRRVTDFSGWVDFFPIRPAVPPGANRASPDMLNGAFFRFSPGPNWSIIRAPSSTRCKRGNCDGQAASAPEASGLQQPDKGAQFQHLRHLLCGDGRAA